MPIIESLIDFNNERMGILCFCDTFKEPVLWSHYADKHRGVAFEVSVEPNPAYVIRMRYSPEPPAIDANIWEKLRHNKAELFDYLTPSINDLMRQKSPGWAYDKSIACLSFWTPSIYPVASISSESRITFSSVLF
jgi:hypothetical protein